MIRVALLAGVCLFCLQAYSQTSTLGFTTSDTAVQRSFDWAKAMALTYRGDSHDPVGPWYEAALPSRDAFCIRDVSHQCLGAEMLGMSRENKNMLERFLKNISASKDWCTFWEINKWNLPAPEDYKSDKAFWYNLNANFELIYACERLYKWTGDTTYIFNAANNYFFERTLNDFIQKWKLEPDSIFTRPTIANLPQNFAKTDNYIRSRGLPSYVENIDNLGISADLVAAIYRGFMSYSAILKMKGDTFKSRTYETKAIPYLQQLNSKWWDGNQNKFYTFYTTDGRFGLGEGTIFLLWFSAIDNTPQKQVAIQQLLKERLNIETISYLPQILYNEGFDSLARSYLLYISDPSTPRREYPEASFGVVEGIVQGLMGIEADFFSKTIRTCYRGNKYDKASIHNLPVFQSLISVSHQGKRRSVFTNSGNRLMNWQPYFAGEHRFIYVNGRAVKGQTLYDASGNSFSSTTIKVEGKKSVLAEIK